MTFTVFHFQNSLMRDIPRDNQTLIVFVREHFHLYHSVAKVEAADAEHAYLLTNTIDGPWWTNPGVRFLGSPEHGMKGCRSTSVGDVLDSEGAKAIVSVMGFVPLPESP